ncbi:unnamed protein product, partial [Caenorhabditis auriculariae]
EGDRVLEVNNVSVADKTADEIVALLNRCDGGCAVASNSSPRKSPTHRIINPISRISISGLCKARCSPRLENGGPFSGHFARFCFENAGLSLDALLVYQLTSHVDMLFPCFSDLEYDYDGSKRHRDIPVPRPPWPSEKATFWSSSCATTSIGGR